MSKLAYHAGHYKSGNIHGIAMHNWEKRGQKDLHSNQDIDPSRSHLNVQLIDQERTLYMSIKKDIEERCTGRVTKASNWMSETITYPPENILGDRDKCIAYFKDVLEWHKKEFGAENVKSSVIHFDETTEHLHTDLIPMTKDGRLSSKDVFSRANLNRHHTELAKFLQERGWDVQRGESTKDKPDRKPKTVKEYKRAAEATRAKLQKEIESLDSQCNNLVSEHNDLVKNYNGLLDRYGELEKDAESLSEDVQKLRDIKDRVYSIDDINVQIKGFGANKRVEVPLKDWEHVSEVYKKNPALEHENYEVRAGNSRLTQENHRLNNRLNEIVQEKMELQKEVKELRPLKDFLQVHNLLDKAKQWYQELQRKRQRERPERDRGYSR